MSDKQEKNLLYIKQSFDILVDYKYRKGDIEHKGDLESLAELSLIDAAIAEAIDQVVYLITLKRKMTAI